MINNKADSLAAFSDESKSVLASIFHAAEPKFPDAIAEFGITDLIRYNQWLRITSRLSAGASGGDVESLIVQKLNQPGTDPRAVLAYLTSPEGASAASAGIGSPGRSLVAITSRYAAQFPSNQLIGHLNSTIAARTDTPR